MDVEVAIIGAGVVGLAVAAELSRRVHTEVRVVTQARDRLRLAPPELN